MLSVCQSMAAYQRWTDIVSLGSLPSSTVSRLRRLVYYWKSKQHQWNQFEAHTMAMRHADLCMLCNISLLMLSLLLLASPQALIPLNMCAVYLQLISPLIFVKLYVLCFYISLSLLLFYIFFFLSVFCFSFSFYIFAPFGDNFDHKVLRFQFNRINAECAQQAISR